MMGFRPHPALEEFLWVYFCGPDLRKIYDGSNVPQINYGDVANIPLVAPSEAEGKEIARRVDDLLSASENGAATVKNSHKAATALRQSILKAAFEGSLVPQDPADEPASALLARLRDSNHQTTTRRRRARAKEAFSHPSLPSLTRQSLDPRVEPAGED
jgi:type I restriction enzyme, S subunit